MPTATCQPIYATETSGVWGTATELPAGGSGFFIAVSCTDPTDCSAIGTSDGVLSLDRSAGVWSAPATIASDNGTIVVTSLSCTSTGNCTTVGYEAGGGGKGPGVTSPRWMAHGAFPPRSQCRVALAVAPCTESTAPTPTTARRSATRTLLILAVALARPCTQPR